ncbi:COMM domain-containing protein 10-like [Diorhabda carinulata]|uniref:COMM domain-containing protein 10-like n=1 Tax=Diorhabda carinulata TaxID=1163345 RepID=UPI0025A08C54|nr:COMM domain-containing protein 10-like [Diorhabda carinulata]
MSLKWIHVNERLIKGIELINSVSTKKFKLLLIHIVSAKSEAIFTEDELKKLKESLKLDDDSLQLLIQCISHIFRQSTKVILKPTSLYKQLTEQLNITEEKSEEFVRIWCKQTNEDFDNFNNKMKLENLSWEINIQGADQINNKQSVPIARVQLQLTKSDNEKKERIVMEFDRTELLQLYNNLEKIQVKLDQINSV